MSIMRTSTIYSPAIGGNDHEIARSTTASPSVGALDLSEEDHIAPCDEANTFGVIDFHLAEDPVHVEHLEGSWSGLAATSSPGSSDSSAFTPTEDIFCPSSPYSGLPEPDSSFQPIISHNSIHELHHLAADVGMQSPASYYPNSPTDSFSNSDTHPLPPPSMTTSPAAYQPEDINMDVTSAPRPLITNPPKPSNVDRPYAQLLRDCFLSRPDYSMALKDIYQWFEQNTTKCNPPGKGWQNSIRHNLSMNRAFKKQDATHMQLNAGNDKGSSQSRNNVWTMEQWAVEGQVQSTTRYRKSNAPRKTGGHRHTQHRRHVHPSGLSNYMLAGNDLSRRYGMNRAAAGRRGGVATRHKRERQRAEVQQQQQQQHLDALSHSSPQFPVGNITWSAPRTFPPNMISDFAMSDNVRMGGPNSVVPSYMSPHGAVQIGHSTMYGQQLPGSSQYLGLGISGSHSTTTTADVSPAQGHQSMPMVHMPTADMHCGAAQGSSQQHQQDLEQQHHQIGNGLSYESLGRTGNYNNGNGVHAVHQSTTTLNSPNFGSIGSGLKNCGVGNSTVGGA